MYKKLKMIWEFVLSLLFIRESFSYTKILSIHQRELPKITGNLHQKDSLLYILPYKNYTREMLWSLKFKNNKQVATMLGQLLYEVLPEQLIAWEQFDGFENPLLITIPSSKQTVLKRGFDQNTLIIQSFIKEGGNEFVEYIPRIIKKIKHTKPQSRTANKAERLLNQQNAFVVTNDIKVRNRNIILFDDIYTTGATINEVKKILHQAKVKQIKVVTICYSG